jgi:hypothetical protein
MIEGRLVSTCIVEIEREGMIHRGYYQTDGAVVIVRYGGQEKRLKIRQHDEPHVIARQLLRAIIIEIHKFVEPSLLDVHVAQPLAWPGWRPKAQ